MNPSKLFEAIREGKLETVKKLLEEGCDLSSLEEGGHNNALTLAAYMRQPEMIEVLLKKGAGVNDRTTSGRTALHNAVWQYDKRSVELLLEAGADIHIADNSNWTPIWLSNRWESFATLVERGARVDGVDPEEGETLLRKIAVTMAPLKQDEGIKMLNKLVELGLKVSNEKPDDRGETLLMEVIDRSSINKGENQIAHWLLKQGMDPLHVSDAGTTALHYACKVGDLDMVKTLLSLRADVNALVTEDGGGFKVGMSPMDSVTQYGKERKSILAEFKKAGAGKGTPKPAMDLEIEDNVVQLKGKNRKAILEHILEITKDLKANVFSHPDYNDPDHYLDWEFPGEEIDEADFFSKCVDDPTLRPLVVRYVSQILNANEKEEEPIYVHEELEAGGYAMQSLVTTGEEEYLELLNEYIHSIDIDHTVHLYDLMDVARSVYNETQLATIESALDELGLAR
ncbi:ankyrin repeat protein [Leptospira weilii serovar Ranarum str. ICFT]|uniref:Ankyrin repeat protein n=1 Tax=Leptospira weilii serovar Ranarum str. ICFT TaxID=1218598 RepID=N1WUQ3_9LEPT|nr:ankyrin repeat domain-containing protein [Leptospira weilii]EMY79603.1 ankyrin repeat protein [Leptospira weilii serovar Ranarum str. ICFT]